ncbi:MAG: murein hydrolase activator EnvC family protein, partial [Actinomycetales bacterium]
RLSLLPRSVSLLAVVLIASVLMAPLTLGQEQPPVATWPVDPAVVLAEFNPPRDPWGPGHRGIDLAAEAGEPVRSIGPGNVAYVGVIAGKPVVAIKHPSGLRSTYEPVVAEVAIGALVQGGERIGIVADPSAPGARLGHCSARCLHLGLRYQGVYIDPMLLLRSRAILLPLGQVN